MGKRSPQCVTKVPIKLSGPIKLRDSITKVGRPEKLAGICISEFAQLFLCFKTHNFNQIACALEISAFQKCYNAHLVKYNLSDEKPGKQVNALLKKFS